MKESQIQKQIIDYLSFNAQRYNFGHFAVLNESGVKSLMIGGPSFPKKIVFAIINHLKKMGMVPGMPDIGIIYRGQIFFMEVKSKKGKANQRQIKIHNWLNDLDVPVEIVRSVEDVQVFLEEIGIIK